MWLLSGPFEGPAFSVGPSSRTMASDGTRDARSGGWSLPTEGLA